MRRASQGVFRGSIGIVALLATACSPGEVVQVEWAPFETAAPVDETTSPPAPESAEPEVPGPEPTEPPAETAVPEPAETAVPEPAETAVPEPAETAVPEPAETAVPEPAETAVPEPDPTLPPSPTIAAVTPAVSPTGAAGPSDSQAALVANGGEVYTLNCARCHAENGLGSAQYSGLIGVGSRYSRAGMIAELTNGHPVTFGFAEKLSDDEIASVVAYVKATFP